MARLPDLGAALDPLRGLAGGIDRLIKTVEGLGTDMAAMRAEVTRMREGVEGLSDGVDALREDFHAVRADVSVMTSDVTRMREGVDGLDARIGDLATSMDDLRGDLGRLPFMRRRPPAA